MSPGAGCRVGEVLECAGLCHVEPLGLDPRDREPTQFGCRRLERGRVPRCQKDRDQAATGKGAKDGTGQIGAAADTLHVAWP